MKPKQKNKILKDPIIWKIPENIRQVFAENIVVTDKDDVIVLTFYNRVVTPAIQKDETLNLDYGFEHRCVASVVIGFKRMSAIMNAIQEVIDHNRIRRKKEEYTETEVALAE